MIRRSAIAVEFGLCSKMSVSSVEVRGTMGRKEELKAMSWRYGGREVGGR